MMRSWSYVLVALLGALGCSESSEETGSGGAASTASSTGAGGGGGSTSSTGGAGGEFEGPFASLQAVNTVSATMEERHVVSAGFWATGVSSTCASQEEGACRYYACDGSTTDLPPQLNAGDVSVVSSLMSFDLTWDDADGYAAVTGDGLAYADGDTLTFGALGSADWPSFDETLEAPSPIVIDSSSFTPVIRTSEAFTLDWTSSGASGRVFFRASTTRYVDDVSVERTGFYCEVPVADGTLTVPATVTSQLLVTGETGCPGAGCERTTVQVGHASFTDAIIDQETHQVSLGASWGAAFSGAAPTSWTVEP